MQPSETGIKTRLIRTHSGFSLIELLVVLVIIGIVMGFVVLAFGDFGETRKIEMYQRHFGDLIKLAKIHAIVEAKTHGIHINSNGYQFYQFYHEPDSPYGKWLKLNDLTFKPLKAPRHKSHKYKVNNVCNNGPEIIITPEGYISPFSFAFTAYDGATITLAVNRQSEVSLRTKLPD